MEGAALREKIDAVQQRHRVLAFPYAVHKRFTDDQGGHNAALISYYGFFSLFPLLLAFVSVIGIVLKGNPDLQQDIIDSALGQIPVLGTTLSVNGLSGSGWALVIGLGTAIWAGLGVVYAMQDAMNTMWARTETTRVVPSQRCQRSRSRAPTHSSSQETRLIISNWMNNR